MSLALKQPALPEADAPLVIRSDPLSLTFADRTVLRNLSLHIHRGAKIALLGQSGVGKSTLLKLIAGIHRPTTGKLENRAQRLGYAFQEPRLLPWLTVADNIHEVMKAQKFSSKQRKQKIDQLLDIMGLHHSHSLYPHQLSGGMAQRVSLARAFSIEPDLLLLDEPFSALDQTLRQQLSQYLAELLQPSTTLLYVSHNPEEALQLTSQCLLLRRQAAHTWFDTTTADERQRVLTELHRQEESH